MLVGILECGRNKPEWIAEHGGFADWFPAFLGPAAPALRFAVWRADMVELPEREDECDAWLLTGSPMSVNDQLPWQGALSAFVQQARLARPIVGICYGHQHLHQAFGGRVDRRLDWGVGVEDYAITSRPTWLDEIGADTTDPTDFRLIALHQDHVVEPAPDTRVLAASADCPYAVTQIGDNVLTFQPHPEMTPQQAALIYELHRQDMGEACFVRAMASLGQTRSDRHAGEWIARFIEAKAPHATDSI